MRDGPVVGKNRNVKEHEFDEDGFADAVSSPLDDEEDAVKGGSNVQADGKAQSQVEASGNPAQNAGTHQPVPSSSALNDPLLNPGEPAPLKVDSKVGTEASLAKEKPVEPPLPDVSDMAMLSLALKERINDKGMVAKLNQVLADVTGVAVDDDEAITIKDGELTDQTIDMLSRHVIASVDKLNNTTDVGEKAIISQRLVKAQKDMRAILNAQDKVVDEALVQVKLNRTIKLPEMNILKSMASMYDMKYRPYNITSGEVGGVTFAHTCNNLNHGSQRLIETFLKDKASKGLEVTFVNIGLSVNSERGALFSDKERKFLETAIDTSLANGLNAPKFKASRPHGQAQGILPSEMGPLVHMKKYALSCNFNGDEKNPLDMMRQFVQMRGEELSERKADKSVATVESGDALTPEEATKKASLDQYQESSSSQYQGMKEGLVRGYLDNYHSEQGVPDKLFLQEVVGSKDPKIIENMMDYMQNKTPLSEDSIEALSAALIDVHLANSLKGRPDAALRNMETLGMKEGAEVRNLSAASQTTLDEVYNRIRDDGKIPAELDTTKVLGAQMDKHAAVKPTPEPKSEKSDGSGESHHM